MRGGLLDRDWNFIHNALERFPEIHCAILFGSRAIGNYKNGSDVDIAVIGPTINLITLTKLNELLNEVYPLPYMFDLHDYQSITNENLKSHIDTYGQIVYGNYD